MPREELSEVVNGGGTVRSEKYTPEGVFLKPVGAENGNGCRPNAVIFDVTRGILRNFSKFEMIIAFNAYFAKTLADTWLHSRKFWWTLSR